MHLLYYVSFRTISIKNVFRVMLNYSSIIVINAILYENNLFGIALSKLISLEQ